MVSVLAVFGAYAIFRLLFAVSFLPREAGLLLRIPADTDPAELPFLLEAARENALFAPRVPIVVLLEKGAPSALAHALHDANITYYTVE